MAYDIIGDVHGHADKLEALLKKLGYQHRLGAWRHPSRAAIFVGDLIDRGPGQLRTLQMVRGMVEAGSARSIMGNHELNAIAWGTPDRLNEGSYLRPRHGERGEKNRRQHGAFLAEVGLDTPEHRYWIEWFHSLPLWIEEENFRVVHACWSPVHAHFVQEQLGEPLLNPDVIPLATQKGSSLYSAVEILLKGAEIKLPQGVTFTDKDGHVRSEIRTRWWAEDASTYAAAYIGPPGVKMPDLPLPTSERLPQPDRPTFLGHYWLDPDQPAAPLTSRVACVDYSAGKGGPLAAYRFDGEQELSAEKYVVC